MKILVWTRDIVISLTAVLGIVSIVALAASALFAVKPLVVVSGSMEPGIPTGSVILSRVVPAEEIVVGDIVTVPKRTGTQLVTHRVVQTLTPEGIAADERELVLRGDANDVDDPYTYTVSTAGRHMLTIPGAGYVVAFSQSRSGVVLAASVVALVVVLLVGAKGQTRTTVRAFARRSTA